MGKNQTLVFVHSREETAKRARFIHNMVIKKDTITQFVRPDSTTWEILTEGAGYSRGITSTPSKSPRVASAGDKGLRHVGEGVLDDSSTQVTSYTSYLHPTLPPSTPPMTPSSPSSTPAFAQICPTLE